MLLAETHTRGEQSHFKAAKLSKYRLTVADAQQSTESEKGSYGGCWAAIRKNNNSTRVIGDEEGERIDKSIYQNVAARTLRLRGSDVVVISAYARNGDLEQVCAEVFPR